MERETVNGIHHRFLKEFMDVLIMVKMREGGTSGYGVLKYLHQKFDFLVSPGTVYSVLYSMERDGLITARSVGRKRIYALTPKGETTIKAIRDSSDAPESLLMKQV